MNPWHLWAGQATWQQRPEVSVYIPLTQAQRRLLAPTWWDIAMRAALRRAG